MKQINPILLITIIKIMLNKIFLIILIIFLSINNSFSEDQNICIYSKNYTNFNDLFIRCFDDVFEIKNGIINLKNDEESIELLLKKDNDIWMITWTKNDWHVPKSDGVFHYYHIVNDLNTLYCERYINDVDGLLCLMQYAFSIDLKNSKKCVGQTLFIDNKNIGSLKNASKGK